MNEQKPTFAGDLLQVARGFLMGGADIIPGVSGGTVALILGIYQRLVTAISHFDMTFVRHVTRFEIRAAIAHVDLRFLMALGAGIGIGIVGLSDVMHHLLTNMETRPLTLAAFCGLILASSFLVGKMVERWSLPAGLLCILAGLFAFYITGLKPTPSEPAAWYIFVCGMIGICAMILPGISGAFILLLLGMYIYVTDALKSIKGLPSGDFTMEHFQTIVLFCAGCAVGLLSFSKLLRWLLANHESTTMAVLCGFMVGSLRKIWPFQVDTTPDQPKFKLKQFENNLPGELNTQVVFVVVVAVVAIIFVFALDRISRGSQHVPPLEENPTEADD